VKRVVQGIEEEPPAGSGGVEASDVMKGDERDSPSRDVLAPAMDAVSRTSVAPASMASRR